jgi:site-specific DNA recombinase
MFEMVGVEGKSMRAVKKDFEARGVPTPGGGRYWHAGTIREMIENDVYRPHTNEELEAEARVSPEALATLEAGKCYGIQWYNRTR